MRTNNLLHGQGQTGGRSLWTFNKDDHAVTISKRPLQLISSVRLIRWQVCKRLEQADNFSLILVNIDPAEQNAFLKKLAKCFPPPKKMHCAAIKTTSSSIGKNTFDDFFERGSLGECDFVGHVCLGRFRSRSCRGRTGS